MSTDLPPCTGSVYVCRVAIHLPVALRVCRIPRLAHSKLQPRCENLAGLQLCEILGHGQGVWLDPGQCCGEATHRTDAHSKTWNSARDK